MRNVLNSLKMLLILTVITGGLYTLIITGISQLFFSEKAAGSIIFNSGKAVGSELVGQNFRSEIYFHGRPSAVEYATVPSGASNKSVTNKEFNEYINNKYSELSDKYNTQAIPQELYLRSGSGLDPHITRQAALLQIDRIAHARKMSMPEKIKLVVLVYKNTENRDLGILGEERVNVLKLNLALNSLKQ